MKTFDQVLAKYKKFGVTYIPEENKIKIPATSAFEGMCGANLKERVRDELIENEVDCSQLIWLIDGDHDWKSYFAQIEAEKNEDYSKEDLRLFKNSDKTKPSPSDIEAKQIVDMFPNGGGMVGSIPIQSQAQVEEIIKRYGCTPKYVNGVVHGYDVTGTPEQVAEMFKELSQVPGVSNMGFATDEQIEQLTGYFNNDNKQPSSDKFKSLIATLPPHLKQKYSKMEKAINELSFYGVHLDNMREITEIAKIAGDDKYFTEMLKESDYAILISVPEDSILLYDDEKAAGMDFAKRIGKRIREDLFFGMDVNIRGKVRKGETWDIQKVAASGYILSNFYKTFSDISCNEDYKSVD